MNETASNTVGATGNAVVDGLLNTLRGVVGVVGEGLTTAATGIERVAAARLALRNKTATPVQTVATPTTNPNASDAAKIKLWAQYAAITGGVILAGLLLWKKLK